MWWASTWERIPSVRVTKSFGDKFTLGVSAEEPQTTIGGRGFDSVTTSVAGGAAGTTRRTSSLTRPGNSAGLYNAIRSDGIHRHTKFRISSFKAALDPGWGHYEVFGASVSEFPPIAFTLAQSSARPQPMPRHGDPQRESDQSRRLRFGHRELL